MGLYLSLYPAMLLCPLLIMSHRVSSHTHTHTHTQTISSNKQTHTEEGSSWSSGICSSDCCLVWPSVLCLPLPHWLLGLPPRHSRSHVSLTPSLITPSHPPQTHSPRSHPQCRSLLVFLHRGLRTFQSLLPLCLPDQCLPVRPPSLCEIQVRPSLEPYHTYTGASGLSVYLVYVLWYLCSDHPMFLAYVLLSLMTLFKSYPSVGDLALPLSLLPLWSHTFRCQSTPTHTCTHSHSLQICGTL